MTEQVVPQPEKKRPWENIDPSVIRPFDIGFVIEDYTTESYTRNHAINIKQMNYLSTGYFFLSQPNVLLVDIAERFKKEKESGKVDLTITKLAFTILFGEGINDPSLEQVVEARKLIHFYVKITAISRVFNLPIRYSNFTLESEELDTGLFLIKNSKLTIHQAYLAFLESDEKLQEVIADELKKS